MPRGNQRIRSRNPSDIKEQLEAHGWRVVRGIGDSLWVTPLPDAEKTPLKDLVHPLANRWGFGWSTRRAASESRSFHNGTATPGR
jgi:hypothetical protein